MPCLYLQVIDLGVIVHPGSYLRDFWNLLDAIVVVCALISVSMEALYVTLGRRRVLVTHIYLLTARVFA